MEVAVRDRSVYAVSACKCLLLFCISSSIGACTHVEYARSFESGEAVLKPDEFGPPTGRFEDYQVNEIKLLDPSGSVCAGATTGLSALNAATTARDEAIEERRTEYEYEYNVYAPVAGLYCGGYYRWGSGFTTMRSAPPTNAVQTTEDVGLDMETWELGFVAEGTDQFEGLDWLTWTFGFELAVGKYDWADKEASRETQIKDYDDPILFRMPLTGGLGFYPPFLFGAGLEARGGADLIA